MKSTALIHPFRPEAVFAYRDDGPITQRRFLGQAFDLADDLPNRTTVINLCSDRYSFAVTFAACLLRAQVTPLPPSRAPTALIRLAEEYPDSYCLADGAETIAGLPAYRFAPSDRFIRGLRVPEIPTDRVAAVAFTSGSTGRPKPNRKTWGGLCTVARRTGARLALGEPARDEPGVALVATVPHSHMFGLETSIMLPLQSGSASYCGKGLSTSLA